MPKFAATLASLLLIASSIGVNIARYPQVGRPVDASQRTDAAETANSSPLAQQSGPVETGNPGPLPAREMIIEPEKSPQVPAVSAAKNAQDEKPFSAKPATGTARPQPGPPVSILDVRPLVPVASLRATAGEANPPAHYDEVQRLPPLEQNGSAIAEPQAAGPDDTQSYTATSTP